MNFWNRWPVAKTFDAPGDEIKGVIVALDHTSQKYPVIHIREADGKVRVVRVTQTRLHERLAEEDAGEGDRIWIRYDGEADHAPPGMNRTKQFTVEIRRADSGPRKTDSEASTTATADGTGGRK